MLAIMKLRLDICNEDETPAIKNIQRRSFFGHIHHLNMAYEINIVLFRENSLKWYQNTIKHDFAFVDATGSLFCDVKSYKRLLYYAITVRHPLSEKPPLPVAEYITSNHSKDHLVFFISHVNKYVRSMTSHSSPIFPKIIVLAFSLAIVEGVLDSFNKINLLGYLDKCYKILKEEREEYLNTIPVICSGLLIHAIKRFTENPVPCFKNKTLKIFWMKIMGRMIMTKQFEVLDRLGRSTLVVLTTKYISKDYLNHLHIAEKAINNLIFINLISKTTKVQWKKSWYNNQNFLSTKMLLEEMKQVIQVLLKMMKTLLQISLISQSLPKN